jgi:hypothetical protein
VCEEHRQPIWLPYGHYLVIIIKHLHTTNYYKVWLMSYLFCIGQEPRYRTFICRRRSLLLAANSVVYRFFKFNLIFPSKGGRQITSRTGIHQTRASLKNMENSLEYTSVADPRHFGVDPDPGIHASDKWIRIRMRILLFSSQNTKTPPKN